MTRDRTAIAARGANIRATCRPPSGLLPPFAGEIGSRSTCRKSDRAHCSTPVPVRMQGSRRADSRRRHRPTVHLGEAAHGPGCVDSRGTYRTLPEGKSDRPTPSMQPGYAARSWPRQSSHGRCGDPHAAMAIPTVAKTARRINGSTSTTVRLQRQQSYGRIVTFLMTGGVRG